VAAPARADRAVEEAMVVPAAVVENVADPSALLDHAECQETGLMNANAALINCWGAAGPAWN
jgi:hypothetical protein